MPVWPLPLTANVVLLLLPVELLFDENLSPRLVSRLADLFPDSAHVHDCGLGASEDSGIWQYAASWNFTIVSKDLDFYDRSLLYGGPPKLIWLRTGNCSTTRVGNLLRSFASDIKHFDADTENSLLVLP